MAAEDRCELTSELFALLTARLEDAAGLAAEGQGRSPAATCLDLANSVAEVAGQARAVALAIAALLEDGVRR